MEQYRKSWRNKIWLDGLDSSGSEQERVRGACERGNEISGSITGGEFASQPQQIFGRALYSSSFRYQIVIQKICDMIGNKIRET